eukprot:213022-Chlamydomonas_euryale.AAC.14
MIGGFKHEHHHKTTSFLGGRSVHFIRLFLKKQHGKKLLSRFSELHLTRFQGHGGGISDWLVCVWCSASSAFPPPHNPVAQHIGPCTQPCPTPGSMRMSMGPSRRKLNPRSAVSSCMLLTPKSMSMPFTLPYSPAPPPATPAGRPRSTDSTCGVQGVWCKVWGARYEQGVGAGCGRRLWSMRGQGRVREIERSFGA